MRLDWDALLGDGAVGAGGQPPLQRGHAAGGRPARRGAGDHPDAGDGAAGGGRAAGRRPGRRGLRGGVGEGGLLGDGIGGGTGAGDRVRPVPNVESALVRIERRDVPAVGPEVEPGALFGLVAAGFGQRRKMLRRSLAGVVAAEAFAAAGVNPEARAEELDVIAWGRLAAAVAAEAGRGSGSLLAGAALPAGGLQHLLVLLLPHALAALLDQRSHERRQANGQPAHLGNCRTLELAFRTVEKYDANVRAERSSCAPGPVVPGDPETNCQCRRAPCRSRLRDVTPDRGSPGGDAATGTTRVRLPGRSPIALLAPGDGPRPGPPPRGEIRPMREHELFVGGVW